MTTTALDLKLESLEIKFLDKAGVIPLVSTVTGTGRALLGVIEFVAGAAFALYGLMTCSMDNFMRGAWYASHGVRNITRGCGEAIPILGNLYMFTLNKDLEQPDYSDDGYKRFSYLTPPNKAVPSYPGLPLEAFYRPL